MQMLAGSAGAQLGMAGGAKGTLRCSGIWHIASATKRKSGPVCLMVIFAQGTLSVSQWNVEACTQVTCCGQTVSCPTPVLAQV